MGFKPRKIKFKVYDICHQKSHIVGTGRHDGLDTLDMSDNEVAYLQFQCGECSFTSCYPAIKNNFKKLKEGYILMEYTGMDIHEHQLYEYDVISLHSNSSVLGVITLKNGMWYVTWNQEGLRADLFHYVSLGHCEYAGNYFENQEFQTISIFKEEIEWYNKQEDDNENQRSN